MTTAYNYFQRNTLYDEIIIKIANNNFNVLSFLKEAPSVLFRTETAYFIAEAALRKAKVWTANLLVFQVLLDIHFQYFADQTREEDHLHQQ